jgi:hypothetical protein
MTALYFRRSDPADLRDLSHLMPEWQASANPKAADWMLAPARPDPLAEWNAGTWVMPSPQTEPNYQGFYDALLISAVYNAALEQVMSAATPGPAAALAVLISALQDALNGRPNPPALQSAIWLLLGQLSLPPEAAAELQNLLDAAYLSDLYSLTPPEQQDVDLQSISQVLVN